MHPDPETPFFLCTDASKEDPIINGVPELAPLQLGHKAEYRPITFSSRALKEAVKNLPINYLEALAITDGYNDVYILIRGRKITVLTDDKTAADNANIQRKNIFNNLQQITLKFRAVIYLEGKTTPAADFFRR